MARLAKGGRELLSQMEADLADADRALGAARYWCQRREYQDVMSALHDVSQALTLMQRRLRDDLEPMLQRRADNQPTLEDRLRAVEAAVAALQQALPAEAAADRPPIRIVR